MFKDYPEYFDWEFEFEGYKYKLTCKDNMYKKSYKFKIGDVKILDKEIDKEENRILRERIIFSLNSEYDDERKKSKTTSSIRRSF